MSKFHFDTNYINHTVENKKFNIGDILCAKVCNMMGNSHYYRFAQVEKITPKGKLRVQLLAPMYGKKIYIFHVNDSFKQQVFPSDEVIGTKLLDCNGGHNEIGMFRVCYYYYSDTFEYFIYQDK
jgi:hypothetical protein